MSWPNYPADKGKMKSRIAALMISIAVIAGCASPSPTKSAPAARGKVDTYTKRESALLNYCSALSDTIWGIAIRKQRGMSKDEVTAFYKSHPNQELVLAGIERVYEDKFEYTWNYTLDTFRECGPNIAIVPAPRVETATYCMSRSMLAGLSQEYREAGVSQAAAYEKMPLPGDTTRSIVAKVYAGKRTRALAMNEAWEDCMGPITTK